MANPRVSILMATYNRPQFIARAIESIISQTLADWELLISDDSEDDATEKSVAPLIEKDKRIQYFHRPQKGSIASSSNHALRKAKGEFVAILDDDDWWRDREKLAKQVEFLNGHADYIGCGGWAVIVDGNDLETGKMLKPVEDADIRHVMLYANAIINSTGMFRRVPAGLYDETIPQFADWDFWLKLGKVGKLHNFSEYFLSYRMWHEGSSFVNQRKNVDAAFFIIRRYRHDYPGFHRSYFLTTLYWIYARFPPFIRRNLNAFLSKVKKSLFSR